MANIKKTQSDYVPSIIDIKETLQDLCDYYSTNLVVSKGAERKSYKKKLENIKIIQEIISDPNTRKIIDQHISNKQLMIEQKKSNVIL